eukprot:COSAG02_NODE_1310_length_13323_cov_17.158878_6_plen_235_part_00
MLLLVLLLLLTADGRRVAAQTGPTQCANEWDWQMADSICTSVGARLCTAAELANDVARGTGCGFDNANVWTSDACTDGHIAADGDSRPQDAYQQPTCVADGEQKAVRCCASGAELCAQLNADYSGWPISDSTPIVCGESDVMPSCLSQMGMTVRAEGLQRACCPDGVLSCPMNIPTSCSDSCARALIAFVSDCKDQFGEELLAPIVDPVLATCARANQFASDGGKTAVIETPLA